MKSIQVTPFLIILNNVTMSKQIFVFVTLAHLNSYIPIFNHSLSLLRLNLNKNSFVQWYWDKDLLYPESA